jgi:hypothetical protein
MFKLLYPLPLAIIPGTCREHEDCTEYSVIPDDPTKHRYELHSVDPSLDTSELTMEMLRAILSGMESPK